MISWDTCCSDRRVSPSDSKSTNEIREGRLSSADREKRSLHAAMQTETRCAAITIVKRNYSELTELTGKANEKERGSRPTSAKSLLVDQQLILATSRTREQKKDAASRWRGEAHARSRAPRDSHRHRPHVEIVTGKTADGESSASATSPLSCRMTRQQ